MLKQVLSVSIFCSFSTVTTPFNSLNLADADLLLPEGIWSREQEDLHMRLSVVTSFVSFFWGGLNSSALPVNSLIFSGSNGVSKKNIYLTQPD